MRRRSLAARGLAPALALLAGLCQAAPAAAQSGSTAASYLFRIRVSTTLDGRAEYRALLADPAAPASLAVERGQARVTAASCPALRRAVTALGALPLPAAFLGEPEPYNVRAPRGTQYVFDGFVRFSNGGEGSVSFWAYDVPGRPPDAQLERMRALVQAFDACVRQTG